MKKLLGVFLGFSTIASALPINGLKCVNNSQLYELTIQRSRQNTFEILLKWELDVPGGAFGSESYMATGILNSDNVSLSTSHESKIVGNSQNITGFGMDFSCEIR